MKQTRTIYQNGEHRWLAIVRDPDRPAYMLDTNEYVITDGREALLCDPGGVEVFPAVFSAICGACDPALIKSIFASHQDPDVISSFFLWLEFNPDIKCHISWLWSSFITHYGGTDQNFVPIDDDGGTLTVGSLSLDLIPAHFLHSAGNFNLYDPKAKLLFSGDVGSAWLPQDHQEVFVEDFDAHIRHCETFHRRWIGAPQFKRAWCERVSRLDIDMLCPQHGAIFRGADVQRFINWFDELEVGVLRR